VNHGGSWAVEFGPNFISLIAHHVPYLEELILDQIGMTEPMGLPGGLVSVTVATHLSDKTLKYYLFVRKLQEAWASEIRQVSTLRRLVFASLFFGDATSEYNAFDWEMDEAHEGENIPGDSEEHDVQMSPEDFMSVSTDSMTGFSRHLIDLQVLADTFLHDHIHSLTLEEIWFIGINAPDDGRVYPEVGNAGIGFRQVMEMSAEGLDSDVEYADTEDMDHMEPLTRVEFYGRIISRQRESWWWWDWGRQDLY